MCAYCFHCRRCFSNRESRFLIRAGLSTFGALGKFNLSGPQKLFMQKLAIYIYIYIYCPSLDNSHALATHACMHVQYQQCL